MSGYETINGQPIKVYSEIALERIRQESKWGEQNHHPMIWLSILGEEYGEACEAANEAYFPGKLNGEWGNYREELIQVAAVAIAMVESLDRELKNGK